ncbi:hypothetical protein WDV06_23025 [Streptomyces racemochromogenes]|uniref:Uncharacterized protein n=1 Tax=Streptomyces racemochromogenes TaxID=67353 RepID=A0ABW7PHS9_9ACTN
MVVTAVFLPFLVVFMLFGLDALENALFPGQAEQPGAEREDL